jgi:hypothetical protein
LLPVESRDSVLVKNSGVESFDFAPKGRFALEKMKRAQLLGIQQRCQLHEKLQLEVLIAFFGLLQLAILQ